MQHCCACHLFGDLIETSPNSEKKIFSFTFFLCLSFPYWPKPKLASQTLWTFSLFSEAAPNHLHKVAACQPLILKSILNIFRAHLSTHPKFCRDLIAYNIKNTEAAWALALSKTADAEAIEPAGTKPKTPPPHTTPHATLRHLYCNEASTGLS